MNTCTPVLIHTGKGEGVDEPARRLEGRYFTRGVKNTNMTDVTVSPSPVYKLINTSIDDI
jgi:hypothetical protein